MSYTLQILHGSRSRLVVGIPAKKFRDSLKNSQNWEKQENGHNSAIFWATDSRFCMEVCIVWMVPTNYLVRGVRKGVSGASRGNSAIFWATDSIFFMELCMNWNVKSTKSTKNWTQSFDAPIALVVPSAITQPYFELQTPDFALKFVWIVQINYKSTKSTKKYISTKVLITQSFLDLQTPDFAWKFICNVQPNEKVQKYKNTKAQKGQNMRKKC